MAEVTSPWLGSQGQECAEAGCNGLAWLPRLEKGVLVYWCRRHFVLPKKETS